MRFPIDQNLPLQAALLPRSLGHDAVHTRELELQRATDAYLLEFAEAQNRIVVTLDIDFHTMIATANRKAPSVILLRERGLMPDAVCERVNHISGNLAARLEAGCLITISATSIRVRDLPLWTHKA